MPYKTQSEDTSPEMEKVYFNLLRQAGAAKRYERMVAWTDCMVGLSRSAISREHPQWSRREVQIEWARRQYGEETVQLLIK